MQFEMSPVQPKKVDCLWMSLVFCVLNLTSFSLSFILHFVFHPLFHPSSPWFLMHRVKMLVSGLWLCWTSREVSVRWRQNNFLPFLAHTSLNINCICLLAFHIKFKCANVPLWYATWVCIIHWFLSLAIFLFVNSVA